jgi:hypothetical protein
MRRKNNNIIVTIVASKNRNGNALGNYLANANGFNNTN